ncbi:hypothetical protein HNR23_003175 [Nocardiopsis mwathae]|uniref:MFS transporter n=1 Tax=Nocardiopsis mwathae TaxID=1472723 RepID=A0A7W9YJI0_9ACTN|nr:hypothetical protein [Nocardiopsis mwathae]MBB6173115.1 hypothetical protein [Nocardiopsis mwathae]
MQVSTAQEPAAWTLPGPPAADLAARQPQRRSVTSDIAAGLRAIAARRTLLRATATSTISCAGAGMFVVLCPLLAERVLGDARHGALLLAVVAGAALAANALLARRPGGLGAPDRILWLSTVVLAGGLLLAAAAATPAIGAAGYAAPLLITGAVIVGAAEGPQLTALFAIRHRDAPDRLRSQIFTTGASFKITGFAIGSALAGPLSTWSLGGTVLVAVGVQLAAMLAYAVCRAGRPEHSGRPGGESRRSGSIA